MGNLRFWSTTAGDNDDADPTVNWLEGQAPSTVNGSARAMMATAAAQYALGQWHWVECSATASVASQTVFKLGAAAGDLTSHFHASRRVRLTGGSSTRYATISSASFTAETTVTIAVDSGSLSASHNISALGPAVTNSPIKVLQSMLDADRIADLASDTPVAADLIEFGDVSEANASNRTTLTVIFTEMNPAWTSYTPAAASSVGTITSSTRTGGYHQIGKMVWFRAKITITDNGTGAGILISSLPVAAKAGDQQAVSGYEAVTSGWQVRGELIAGGTTLNIVKYDGAYPAVTGSALIITGVYEAA